MQLQIRYRYDAHRYDPRRGECAAGCPACLRELPVYRTYVEAFEAQPLEERILEDGDQYSIEPPPRRFMIVATSFVD
jgi:hypothetical protein